MDKIELDLELLKKMYPANPEESAEELVKKDKLEKSQTPPVEPLLQEGSEQPEDYKGWAKDIKTIIQQMFGKNKIPVTVKGKPEDIAEFANVLKCHKNFIDKIAQNGVNNIITWKAKAELKVAINKFERKGIMYPYHY